VPRNASFRSFLRPARAGLRRPARARPGPAVGGWKAARLPPASRLRPGGCTSPLEVADIVPPTGGWYPSPVMPGQASAAAKPPRRKRVCNTADMPGRCRMLRYEPRLLSPDSIFHPLGGAAKSGMDESESENAADGLVDAQDWRDPPLLPRAPSAPLVCPDGRSYHCSCARYGP